MIHTETIHLKADPNMKEALKKDPAQVLVNLIKQQRSLYSKNIGDWLAARQAAENVDYPQRVRLYDLYDDMILDEFIHGQIYNHRILPVKNRKFKICNANGEKQEDKAKLLQHQWFDDLIKFWLESIFYGYSLPYFKEMALKDGTNHVKKVMLIPRRHVLQERGFILNWQSDFTGIPYHEEPVSNYCIPAGDKYDLGLLCKAAPLWIIKKHAWQNWDEFAEIFGIPIRVVKTASQDPRVISEIEGWTRDMGTAAYGVFPQDVDIDIKENSKTDAFRVFAEMVKMANEGLAILFSGQTMTSMDGSSRSQAEVHQDVAFEIRKDDEKFITYLANELIQLLRTKHAYPFEEGDYFEWDVPEDVKALLEVFTKVNEMGFQLDPEEVSARLGVKILGLKAPVVLPGATPPPAEKEQPPQPKDEEEVQLKAEILKLHADIAKIYAGGSHVS